ncbi:MAG: hypothetical protein J7577_01760 [Sphingobacteriaceae bacterium]|nr:hypothetical protein [Sphingobacteriaceae bacterium]
MKKSWFLLLLLLSFCTVFAQKRGYNKTEWSVAKQAPCFPNLYVSYKSIGYEPSVTSYGYNWRIENRSDKRVSFTFGPWIVAADGKTKERMNGGLFVLNPGELFTHTPGYNKVVPTGSSMEFFITAYSDVKGGPSYNCVNGTKYCVSNCGSASTTSRTGSNSISKSESGTTVAANGQVSGSGAVPKTGVASVKPNTAEITLQGTRGTYSVNAVIDNVQCPGSIRLSLDPDASDGKKITFYVMPKAESGTFESDYRGNCILNVIMSWFENGKYRYTSPKLTVTKTGLNSFTFTGTVDNGERISGSGNYTLVQ